MISRYADPVIDAVWGDLMKYTQWMTIERVVAGVQAQHQIIPAVAAHQIGGFGLVHTKFMSDVADEEKTCGHDFVAFLNVWKQHLLRQDGAEGARWLHYGLTSSDVQDTALAMRLHAGSARVQQLVDPLLRLLADLGDQHLGTVRVARTHGQYAEPTTLGVKILEWRELVRRALGRLGDATRATQVGKLSGPVGTYAHNPPEVEREALAVLDLLPAVGCSQVIPRDGLAHWAHCVAGLGTACEQIALDFWLLAQSGIEEVAEGYPDGRRGSSSMPHKCNPATAEKIRSLADWARQCAASLQPSGLALERDLTHSARERIAIPSLLHAVCHVLWSTEQLLLDAKIDAKRMLQNLGDAGHAPFTSGVALALVQSGETREWAESAVQAWANHEPHADTLFEDRPGVQLAMQPDYYTRNLEHLRERFETP